MAGSPAVDIVKEHEQQQGPQILTLTSGVRVRVRPVSPQFRDAARARIPDPEVPIWHDEAEDRDVPNPSDPVYLREMQLAELKRAQASMDALVMFGVELVDGVPDDGWRERLRFMHDRGMLDLTGFDLECAIDREYLYKRYIAITDADWALLGPALQSKREEALERGAQLFRRASERNADS